MTTFATQLSAAFTPIQANYDSASVTRALSWAQSEIESYTARTFDTVSDDVVYITPRRYRTALLPGVPVVTVTTVEGLLPSSTGVGAMTWTALTNYRYDSDTGLIYDTTGEPGTIWDINSQSWPWLPYSLKVTYDHGYSTVPQPLVDVGCRLAQQYLENPASVMQRRDGDSEARYSGSRGVLISDLDVRILDRYTDIGIG